MSMEEATGHLRAIKERKKKSTSQAKDERLLLTEEEWMARLKVREGEDSRAAVAAGATAEAGAAAAAAAEAGEHPLLRRMMVCGAPGRLTSVGPVARPASGPGSVGPKARSWPRPT
jgi:hypothetical protein